ncbi:MAG: hypothetical protein ACTSPB_01170 [Candidatus Thorarchaeota archaeon]
MTLYKVFIGIVEAGGEDEHDVKLSSVEWVASVPLTIETAREVNERVDEALILWEEEHGHNPFPPDAEKDPDLEES